MTGDVFDARKGLPPELIAELRAAQLVVLGLKDERTAVARIEFYQDQNQDQDQRVRTVILPAVVHLTHGARLADEKLLIIRDAQHDLLWQKAVDVLGPGDVATIEWALGWAAVSIVLRPGRTRASASMSTLAASNAYGPKFEKASR